MIHYASRNMAMTLIFVLSIPLALIVGLYLVGSGRVAGTPAPEAEWFSDRALSALKRGVLALAIGAAVLFGLAVALSMLPVSVPFFALGWLWVLAVVGCMAWGALRPRVYDDGINRVKNGARIGWGLLFFALMCLSPLAYLVSSVFAQSGVGITDNRPKLHHVTAEKFSWMKFAFAEPVASEMIPKDATDITFNFRFGLGMALGASADLKCHVNRAELERFAKDHGYDFQSDSITKNACPEGAADCDWVLEVYHRYNQVPYPDRFLAYNYRYATCGGYSFLYDVDNELLYADWASN